MDGSRAVNWCDDVGVSLASRQKNGYTICNSAFMTGPEGHKPRVMFTNARMLLAAARSSGLIAMAVDDEANPERARQMALDRAQAEQRRQEIATARAASEEAARVAAEAERKERAAAFQKSLNVGDVTHCGLVIEVKRDAKRPIVKVQAMNGERWLRLDQALPEGSATCLFVGGVYQDR